MKSRSVQRAGREPALSPRRWSSPLNTMNFPQALRDAIPTLSRTLNQLADEAEKAPPDPEIAPI
jgi:hypothetical protein